MGRQRKPQKDQFICNLYSILAFPSCALYVCTHANTHNLHVCEYKRVYVYAIAAVPTKLNKKENVTTRTCAFWGLALLLSLLFAAQMRQRQRSAAGVLDSQSRPVWPFVQ